MISRFRSLQNQLVQEFSIGCRDLHVIEWGGDKKYNYVQYFSDAASFKLTNIEGSGADYVEDITKLSHENNSVEAAICISVLQHVFPLDTAISEIIRVLKPGGKCLITNGFMFPVCMEDDYYRLTPAFWEHRLKNELVDYEIILIGNVYTSIFEFLMRPYQRYKGRKNILNKFLSLPFGALASLTNIKDSTPLGVAVILYKK
jgi:SAM-dependent methyltransferase